MDVDLHYREQGTGEPLILLHGNGEDGSYFERQMDAFASRFRVIALDTRGHGRSPRGEAPFTIRQFADDLLAFMDGQGIERAHLLGFSDGGNIALAFALAHPERVGKLVLNGANLDGGGVKPSVQVPAFRSNTSMPFSCPSWRATGRRRSSRAGASARTAKPKC